MSVVALLDLATFAPSQGPAPEPVVPAPVVARGRFAVDDDDDDDVWDIETADEMPEDLEALIQAAREADL